MPSSLEIPELRIIIFAIMTERLGGSVTIT